MQKLPKLLKTTALLAVSGFILGGCQAANQPFKGQKTNHFNPYAQTAGRYQAPVQSFKAQKNQNIRPYYNQYGQLIYPQPAAYQQAKTKKKKKLKKYKNLTSRLRGEKHLAYQVPAPIPGPFDQFQRCLLYTSPSPRDRG